MRLRTALAVAALVAAASPAVAAARPTDVGSEGYAAGALVCSAEVDATLRLWWSDTPGDGDAPAGVDGDCATRPPWIDLAGESARQALAAADALGFPAPPPDGELGGDDRYDVYVLDLGARDEGLLGLTEPDPGGRTSALLVDESYVDELPPGYPTGPEDELRVTIAHELFHAIQFGMGAIGLPQWILEGTAVWFETHAQPTIADNLGYLVRHLTGDRGRLPLWVQGGCGEACWVPGLPRDAVHVYATWLFFWSAADERGDVGLVRRLVAGLAARPADGDFGLAALGRAAGGNLPVRLREYALALLLRQRVGALALPAALAGGPGREPAATPARAAGGRLWPLQPLFVPVRWPAGRRAVAVQTQGLAAAALRRSLALVLADGRVLRLPRARGDALVFEVPAGITGGTVVLASARAAWPLRYRVTLLPPAATPAPLGGR